MSTIDRPLPGNSHDWRLITLGAVLVVSSLLLAGWLLLVASDVPGGLSALLLTISGTLLIAIGNTESSRPSA